MSETIRPARSPDDFRAAERLIKAYTDELGVDLGFQDFGREIRDLARVYETILLARSVSDVTGCVALKRHDATRCEMKRLFVAPEARGTGLGERLSLAILDEARRRAYREMVLDTLERLGPAIRLYEKLGFRRCAPYYANPEPDAVYMSRAL